MGRDHPGWPRCRDRADLDIQPEFMLPNDTLGRAYKTSFTSIDKRFGGEPLPHKGGSGTVIDG